MHGREQRGRRRGPTTWTFDLRTGVKFQDGQPFTAEDAAFTIDRAVNSDLMCNVDGYVFGDDPLGLKVDSPTKLTVTTKKPDPILPLRLSFVEIVPRTTNGGADAVTGDRGTDPATRRDPVAAGPAVGLPVPDALLEGDRGVRERPAGCVQRGRTQRTVSPSAVSVWGFSLLCAVVLVGALLQVAIGFGLGLVAAPVLAIVEPSLVPIVILVLAFGITSAVLVQDGAHLDLRGTGWALVGRVPGTIAGAVLLVVLPEKALALLVVGMVVFGVVASLRGFRPRPTRTAVAVAGALSGLMGTTTSIGGPPMAMVWQRFAGPRLRSTMGAVVALVALVFSVVERAQPARPVVYGPPPPQQPPRWEPPTPRYGSPTQQQQPPPQPPPPGHLAQPDRTVSIDQPQAAPPEPGTRACPVDLVGRVR